MKICDRCGKREDKRSFCCNACRMAYKRHGILTAEANNNKQEEFAEANKSAPKRTKQDLQEMIDNIKPAPIRKPISEPRTAQNEDGEYLNAPGKVNPSYDWNKGYDEPSVNL